MRFLRRYNSTIYGSYRVAGLRYGALTGAFMSVLFLLAIYFVPAHPITAPENYITDMALLAGILYFSYRYRGGLPDGRVTFKELMLFGLWTGFAASVLYGLTLWLTGLCDDSLVSLFVRQRVSLMTAGGAADSPEMAVNVAIVERYGAGYWGFIGGFRGAVISILFAFVAALLFRTEKAPVVNRKLKTENRKGRNSLTGKNR